MSEKIDISSYMRFAKELEGKALYTTAQKKQFTVTVIGERLAFTPVSSGISRSESRKTIQDVIDYFNETGSMLTKDYHDITYNSVYLLKVIEEYRKQRGV